MNIAPLGREATLEDLFAVEGKAELVDGRLVLLPMTGGAHGNAVSNVVTSLTLYQRVNGGGTPFGDNVGFVLGHRDSIAPDDFVVCRNIDGQAASRGSHFRRRGP